MSQSANTLQTVSYAVGLASPLIVAYVTKRSWSSQVKTLLNTGIVVVADVVAGIVIQPGMSVGSYFRAIASGVVMAFVAHIGYKKTGVTDKVADKGIKDKDPEITEPSDQDYSIVDPDEFPDGDELDSTEEPVNVN